MDDPNSDSDWSDEAAVTNPLENVVPEILSQLEHLDLSSLVLFKERNFIGGGGYGDVFKGRCNFPGRGKTKVAIKRLRFYLKEDIKALFEKEIYVWSKLDHPHVLPLLGYAFVKEFRYPLLISEWMDRGSAWSYVRAHLQCDVLRLIVGIARGLAYLHEQGVVHSDIKADNVLVSTDGDALLCDFGCARMISATRSLAIPSSGIRGTSRYLACELLECSVKASGHTMNSDVWAFGMTAFELISKQRPYANLSDTQAIAAITRHEMPSLPQQSEYRTSQMLDQVMNIWNVCLDCWRHEPDERPTMSSIVDRLTSKQPGSHRAEDQSLYLPMQHSDLDELCPAFDSSGFIVPVATARQVKQRSTGNTHHFARHTPLVFSFQSNIGLKKDSDEWCAKVDLNMSQVRDVHVQRDLKHESPVKCVRFSIDGKFLAVCCRRVIKVYDTRTWQRTCSFYDGILDSSAGLYIESLCFSPDGKFLAFEASGNSIKVWEILTRRVRRVFQGHQQKIRSIEFSHDGTFIVSASSDSTVRIWGMDKIPKRVQPKGLPGARTEMTCAAISPDDRLIAAGSSDSVVRIWETQSGNLIERLRGHQECVTCISFCANGVTLLSGSADSTVKQWDISALVAGPGRCLPLPPEVNQLDLLRSKSGTGHAETHLPGSRRELPDPPSGNPPRGVIIGSSLGAKLALRDGERRTVNVTAFWGHNGHIVGAWASPDGKWIASVSVDHTICIVESLTGRAALMLRCTYSPVLSVTFDVSGGHVSIGVGCADTHARLWSFQVTEARESGSPENQRAQGYSKRIVCL